MGGGDEARVSKVYFTKNPNNQKKGSGVRGVETDRSP